MQHKTLAIAGEHERHLQRGGIVQRLLHSVTGRELALLCLDQGDRHVLPVKNEIRLLGLAPADQPAAHDDAALGE